MAHFHWEFHRADRIGWLRAAVLGANDGTISVASLVVGVATAGQPHSNILLTAIAGLVAGAMSMAAGEYVSVRSQLDTERADLERERRELEEEPERELAELAAIYEERGLDPALARQVAKQLSVRDALGAHLREELGITETLRARPIQAALTSALSFALGALVPLVTALLAPVGKLPEIASLTALASLVILGGAAAYAGGASMLLGAWRVAFWGATAMAFTAAIGRMFGAAL